jgi:hypothetical protein
MVKWSSSLLILGLAMVGTATGDTLMVQSQLTPVKVSNSLEPGQRFECQKTQRLEVYGCPIYFAEGTIGLRLTDSEFFIAKGSIRIGALPPEEPTGPRRSPLVFRFIRGRLLATGLEWLNLNHNEEVRWYKEANAVSSTIEVDGVSTPAEEQTLFVATKNNILILDRGNLNTIATAEVEQSSLEELLLRYHRRRDAQASPTQRGGVQIKALSVSPFHSEKQRALRSGFRYGANP